LAACFMMQSPNPEEKGVAISHGVLGLDSLASPNIFIDRGGKFCHITSTCVIVVCHIEPIDGRFYSH
jgi:hypothetical protein